MSPESLLIRLIFLTYHKKGGAIILILFMPPNLHKLYSTINVFNTIIYYWSKGPKATFFYAPSPFLRILNEIDIVSPKKLAKKGKGHKN